jgi:hypothetical protein
MVNTTLVARHIRTESSFRPLRRGARTGLRGEISTGEAAWNGLTSDVLYQLSYVGEATTAAGLRVPSRRREGVLQADASS